MDRRLFGQIVQRAVLLQMAGQNILNRGAHEEILLPQAQGFPLRMIVLRIEHLADHLGHGLPFQRFHIIPLVEGHHVDLGRFGAPQPQNVDRFPIVAGHHQIVGHGVHHRAVPQDYAVIVAAPAFLHPTGKMHIHRIRRPGLQPDAAAGQPEIRHFGLPAVHNLLAEDAEFVSDAVTHRRIAKAGQ